MTTFDPKEPMLGQRENGKSRIIKHTKTFMIKDHKVKTEGGKPNRKKGNPVKNWLKINSGQNLNYLVLT